VGLQALFAATVPNEFLAEKTTPWVLQSVRRREVPDRRRVRRPAAKKNRPLPDLTMTPTP